MEVLLMLLCVVVALFSMLDEAIAQGMSYKDLYNQVWATPQLPSPSPSVPPTSSFTAFDATGGFGSGSVYNTDPYYTYSGRRNNFVGGTAFSPPGPPPSLPAPPLRPVVPPSARFSSGVGNVPADLVPLIPQGFNVGALPKSALAGELLYLFSFLTTTNIGKGCRCADVNLFCESKIPHHNDVLGQTPFSKSL
jgi:hypothetical protein